MAVTPDKTPGAFAGPPDGAPHEVTLPGSEAATPEQIAQARANELDMPAFAPKPMSLAQMASFLGKSEAEILEMRPELGAPQVAVGVPSSPPAAPAPATSPSPGADAPQLVDPAGQLISSTITATGLRRVSKPAPPLETPVETVTLTEPAPQTLAEAARAQHPQTVDPDQPYRPAASNTDSPARGASVARTTQSGLPIGGGFGDLGEAQYFPLTGDEAGKVAISLLQALIARIPDDLRFSMAATYPRLTMRAVLEVQAFGNDHGFLIEKRQVPPHTKTPLDVARAHADEICFVVIESHVEMTEDGESVTPPNAARVAQGLPVPRKQSVATPGGRLLVDVRQ